MITKVYRNPKSLKTKIMLDKAGLIVYHEKKKQVTFSSTKRRYYWKESLNCLISHLQKSIT